jgi:hypothetical protein
MVAVDPPQQMVTMPAELQPIVMRCLAKHPDGRYNSVAELASDLARFSRDPERARMLVERMWRTQQRSTFGGVGGQSMSGASMSAAASASGGVPMYRPDHEAPSSPAMPNLAGMRSGPIAMGGGVVVAPTFDNRSAPVTLREPKQPRRWLWLAIPIVLAAAAAGIVVAIAGGGNDDGAVVTAGSAVVHLGVQGSAAAAVTPDAMLEAGSAIAEGSAAGSGSGAAGSAAGSGSGSGAAGSAVAPGPGAGSPPGPGSGAAVIAHLGPGAGSATHVIKPNTGNTTKVITHVGTGSSAVVQQRPNPLTTVGKGSAALPPSNPGSGSAVKHPDCDPFGSRTKCH